MNIILLGHIGFMICSMVVLMLVLFVKPGGINPFVGYRTPLSMKNEETWREANRYSARIQIRVSIIFCMLTVSSYLFVGGMTSFYLCSSLLAVLSILVIPITEYNLRKKFDADGNYLS